MKSILNRIYSNEVEGNMSLEDNHRLVNESLVRFTTLFNQYGIDYYIVGALPCFLKTGQQLFRYHDDIDIMINEDDIPKLAEIIELSGLRPEEQDVIGDIVFLLKEILNEDKTKNSLALLSYLYQFISVCNKTKEAKYILGYFSKANGFTNPTSYEFDDDGQFVFESIMYSAMTLYNNGGASRTKLAESHRRWDNELSKKNEEKLSRTQELNTAKVLALKELGYTEINEHNASEVFDKIAEIQSRGLYNQ